LTDVFASHRPDFVLLCSSLSAVLGGVGQLDYCAANCYLDAFAHANAFRKAGTMTISINWDTWADVGMAVNTDVPDDLKRWQAEGLKRGIVRREGMDVFERVLSGAHPQVLVSTTNLGERLRQATSPPLPERQEIPVVRSAPSHPRPPLDTEYTKPQAGSEERIAQLWEELLGIHPVGAHDDFLALGGHSLLAIQLISRLRDSFGVEVSVQTFFENPTVAALGRFVEPRNASQPTSERKLEAPPLVRVPREQYRAVRTPEGVHRVPGRMPQDS
jgi:acyl carrier protein